MSLVTIGTEKIDSIIKVSTSEMQVFLTSYDFQQRKMMRNYYPVDG